MEKKEKKIKRKQQKESEESNNESEDEITEVQKKQKPKKQNHVQKVKAKVKEEVKVEVEVKVKKKKKTKKKDSKVQGKLENFGIKSIKEDKNKKTYPKLPSEGKLKFIHWNINGLRPLLKTKELDTLIKEENPDFICFNEIKIDEETIEKMSYKTLLNDIYKSYWSAAEKKGYAGT